MNSLTKIGRILTITLFAVGIILSWAALPTERVRADVSQKDIAAVAGKQMDDPEFEAFLRKLPSVQYDIGHEPYYIVEGDLRLTAKQVWARVNGSKDGSNRVSPNSELNVMVRAGVSDKWPIGHRQLTYAIDKRTFDKKQYEIVRRNFEAATVPWVTSCKCGLSIKHNPKFDAAPTTDNVTFVIQYDPAPSSFLALAPFPGDPKSTRILKIFSGYFTDQEFNKIGMLRHEIGHILGYRHSHLGVKECSFYGLEDPNWKPVSPYTRNSVMHYICNGGGSPEFQLSKSDKRDHRKYYSN
ncbi:hypothetical protein [Phyllobacterium chamaecytisi]|uniref:hypothetical protein n=1 Tax=Phyllobacterium chamaecytisi TaxID=2876082 RepID=UPI001CCCED06|nr:hypothetical protein [Phyllobacterium sp. KW56]MBZ9602604.1 hypothetical protein [Phyllobacterium sp. KW56]